METSIVAAPAESGLGTKGLALEPGPIPEIGQDGICTMGSLSTEIIRYLAICSRIDARAGKVVLNTKSRAENSPGPVSDLTYSTYSIDWESPRLRPYI